MLSSLKVVCIKANVTAPSPPLTIHFSLLIFSPILLLPFQKLTTMSSFVQSLSRPPMLNGQGSILEVAIEAAANAVINLRDRLNEWDSKAGDGDCGSTVSPLNPIFISLEWHCLVHRVDILYMIPFMITDVQGSNSYFGGHEEFVSLLLSCFILLFSVLLRKYLMSRFLISSEYLIVRAYCKHSNVLFNGLF